MPPPLQDDEEFEEPPQIRRLRLLVTVLTAVMIFGMLTVVAAVVIRLGAVSEGDAPNGGVGIEAPVAAERFTLPESARITALGRGASSVLLVTDGPEGEVLRTFDAATGKETGRAAIVRE